MKLVLAIEQKQGMVGLADLKKGESLKHEVQISKASGARPQKFQW